MCHICGREFGSASIDVHIPQCMKKWEAQEAKKPPAQRRSAPSAPTEQEGMTRDEYNAAAYEKWNDEALMACPNCGRTFLPDRLEVHLRSCKPKNQACYNPSAKKEATYSEPLRKKEAAQSNRSAPLSNPPAKFHTTSETNDYNVPHLWTGIWICFN